MASNIEGAAELAVAGKGFRRVARLWIFLAHLSVGTHIVDSVPEVFQDYGVDTRNANEGIPCLGGRSATAGADRTTPGPSSTTLRRGSRTQVSKGVRRRDHEARLSRDEQEHDMPILFAECRTMMAAMERELPDVTFLRTTISVTRWTPKDNRRTNASTRCCARSMAARTDSSTSPVSFRSPSARTGLGHGNASTPVTPTTRCTKGSTTVATPTLLVPKSRRPRCFG